MTGFGAGRAERKGLAARAEVRSVNHRHLQLKSRLPLEFGHLEAEVDALVRKTLARGSVVVVVHLEQEDGAVEVSVNEAAARKYLRELGALQQGLKVGGELSIADVANLPGVIRAETATPSADAVQKVVMDAVKQGLTALVEMREVEGAAMERDLVRRGKAIDKLRARIERRAPKVVAHHHKQLRERVDELLAGRSGLQPGDLAREMALIADRLDVTEELTRLASHLDQLASMLQKGGSVGRQLDFLAQEFLREANTIGSKASDAALTHLVVELKTEIERLREQVQNVE
jgi:uncharacterized protein (TIGR00255 family)